MSLPTPERDCNNLSLTRGKGVLFMVSSIVIKLFLYVGRRATFSAYWSILKRKEIAEKVYFYFYIIIL